ncbi:LCP family protein [Bacillus sp. AFS017336]|uniref:LCP family protein n=1 Tax=Bacillus sp. AFS017336 TaxID=2033489 RepID=UPI00211D5B84|nr:LCP family protein [Bacillus sp. AFS017336]
MNQKQNQDHSRKMAKKRKKKRRSVIGRVLLLVIIIALIFVGYKGVRTYLELNKATKGEDISSNLRNEKVAISKDPISILFLGIENYATGGKGGRTDSMILATFNPKKETIKTMSIPRDTYVDIPGHAEKTKINHAYAYGGLQLTVDTVENFLNVPIDYYVTVDFNGFKNIVDAVGGIDVDVPFDFWENTDTHPRKKVYFTKGMMHLNGQQALAYARMRKRDPRGDFGREERQQQVIKSILAEIKSPETIMKMDEYAKVFSKNVSTNMKLSGGISLAKHLPNISPTDLETLKLEGHDATINKIYYYVPEEQSVQDISSKFRVHLGLDKPPAKGTSNPDQGSGNENSTSQ